MEHLPYSEDIDNSYKALVSENIEIFRVLVAPFLPLILCFTFTVAVKWIPQTLEFHLKMSIAQHTKMKILMDWLMDWLGDNWSMLWIYVNM